MSRKTDFSNYPLPEALTRRVVTYLNVFRLFISLALVFAFFSGLLITPSVLDRNAIAGAMLISYLLMAVFLAYETQRRTARPFFLTQVSLFTDVFFLSILLFIFGGLDSGLAILLIFASASAAILLPFRIALLFASLVALAFVGESLAGMLLRNEAQSGLVQAGLYGVTTFIITILVNLLSYWIKDYRLIAERQAVELTRLEQINELVIRRMRSGVLAVDSDYRIQLMNESAWFLLGSPSAQRKLLAEISPQLQASLVKWRDDPALDVAPVTLHASRLRLLPKFVSLPGTTSIRFLIFLEDNDVVSQRALEMSAHLLANLSGSIAHEIRNPLAAISHSAQLLAESEEIVDADLRLVDIIHNQSRRMNDIVENILQLSRHEKSRPDIFELAEFLQELALEIESSLPAIRLTLEIGSGEDEVLVLIDRSQLHQALWQLLENAMRHAYLDAVMPKVSLRLEYNPAAGYCIITVEDNGPGIPDEQMTRIFEPFFTTHKEGSGLGLYIARQLCDVNQAELTVDSTLGSGTRFHVRLALAQSERDQGVQAIGAPATKARRMSL
jgi:two-component system, NtrC family, sensor histidine kinase PilS